MQHGFRLMSIVTLPHILTQKQEEKKIFLFLTNSATLNPGKNMLMDIPEMYQLFPTPRTLIYPFSFPFTLLPLLYPGSTVFPVHQGIIPVHM